MFASSATSSATSPQPSTSASSLLSSPDAQGAPESPTNRPVASMPTVGPSLAQLSACLHTRHAEWIHRQPFQPVDGDALCRLLASQKPVAQGPSQAPDAALLARGLLCAITSPPMRVTVDAAHWPTVAAAQDTIKSASFQTALGRGVWSSAEGQCVASLAQQILSLQKPTRGVHPERPILDAELPPQVAFTLIPAPFQQQWTHAARSLATSYQQRQPPLSGPALQVLGGTMLLAAAWGRQRSHSSTLRDYARDEQVTGLSTVLRRLAMQLSDEDAAAVKQVARSAAFVAGMQRQAVQQFRPGQQFHAADPKTLLGKELAIMMNGLVNAATARPTP